MLPPLVQNRMLFLCSGDFKTERTEAEDGLSQDSSILGSTSMVLAGVVATYGIGKAATSDWSMASVAGDGEAAKAKEGMSVVSCSTRASGQRHPPASKLRRFYSLI